MELEDTRYGDEDAANLVRRKKALRKFKKGIYDKAISEGESDDGARLTAWLVARDILRSEGMVVYMAFKPPEDVEPDLEYRRSTLARFYEEFYDVLPNESDLKDLRRHYEDTGKRPPAHVEDWLMGRGLS